MNTREELIALLGLALGGRMVALRVIDAIEAASCVVVPREPTQKMIAAWCRGLPHPEQCSMAVRDGDSDQFNEIYHGYKEMIAASPFAPETKP